LEDRSINDLRPLLKPESIAVVGASERFGAGSLVIKNLLSLGYDGSVILALANSNRGIGFSALISSGNEAVLDTTDYLDYFLEDESTTVIIAFLEGIRRPDVFVQACVRAAKLNKPIIAVKIGRSELAQKAAVTHTGALTGSDKVHDALFRKLGVTRVDDLDQLLETAAAFVNCRDRLPMGDRVGVITVSGGEIGLIGDLAEKLCLSFPPPLSGISGGT